MNKLKFVAIFAAVLAIPALAAAQSAPSTGDAVSSADTSSSAAVSVSAPSTGDTVTSADDSSSGSATVSAPSVGSTDTSAGASVTTTQSSGGGVSSGSSSSSSSSGGSIVPIFVTAAGSNGAATTSCPLITSFMTAGAANDAAQVTRLQEFLQASEGANVTVNGVYDAQTQAAVSAFQSKYMSDIMGPWGATQTSGSVYLTTQKKINQLACGTPLTLTASDLAAIASYQANGSASSSNVIGLNTAASGNANVAVAGPSIAGASASSTGNANVAAVGNSTIASRFWSFIKNLFHR